MDEFYERPVLNERDKALRYISKLINKARKNPEDNQSDINELLEIQKLINQKKYGLVWEEHNEMTEEKLKKYIPVFEEVKKKNINNGKGKYNFLLEGDNLYTLNLLNRTHKGKIDFIYIDPPYNTGNNDFMYNDKFVKKDDTYLHSKWLSFMKPRLQLAKELLSPDGIIAVSIDNHEGYQLKLLLDEIFGEDHLAADLHIETSAVAGPRRLAAVNGSVVKTAEFIFVYTKGVNTQVMKRPLYDGIQGYDKHYSKFLDSNTGQLINLTEVLKNTSKISKKFDNYNLRISLPNLNKIVAIDDDVKEWLFSDKISKKLFRLSGEFNNKEGIKLIKGINRVDNKYVVFKNNKPYYAFRYFDRLGMTDDYKPSYMERSIRGNLWKGFSSDGGNLRKEGGVSFKNGKKPLRLIKQLIKSMTPSDKPITVLDFFAGSGTTGEAVMQLNKENLGKYNFIIATNDEVVDITYKRMLYTNKHNPMNMKYFRVKFVDKKSSSLESDLLKNVRSLIELQYGINFEDSSFKLVTKRNEVKSIDLTNITKVFMRSRVHYMMIPEQQERYHNAGVEIIDIPENYFSQELQGWV